MSPWLIPLALVFWLLSFYVIGHAVDHIRRQQYAKNHFSNTERYRDGI